jgi:hypothetical protein
MLWSLRFTVLGLAALSIVVLGGLLNLVPFLAPLPTGESVIFVAVTAWVIYWLLRDTLFGDGRVIEDGDGAGSMMCGLRAPAGHARS